MEPVVDGHLLSVDLGSVYRCLASSVVGGGLGAVRTWVNLQVPPDYARVDPAAHLREVTAGFAAPVVGMLTAAPVARFQDVTHGSARAFATVGLGHPMAAAGIRPPDVPSHGLPGAGTINIFAVTEAPLTDAALTGAVQTLVEAKVQALTQAGIGARNRTGFATGTASDALAIACPPGATVPFAGSATDVGHDLAWAVWTAVTRGCEDWEPNGT